MIHAPAPDLNALAAQLRLMALGLLAELMEFIGLGALAAGLRRRMGRELAVLERFATGIVVLMAVRSLPTLPAMHGDAARPLSAPRGFARVATNAHAMRAMQRKLFPKLRDLRTRLARFDAILDDVAGAARRLVRHIEHIPPATRLLAIAPPALVLAGVAAPACCADDSS